MLHIVQVASCYARLGVILVSVSLDLVCLYGSAGPTNDEADIVPRNAPMSEKRKVQRSGRLTDERRLSDILYEM